MKFDRIARYYGWIERLTTGSRMQGCRLAHLAKVRTARNVLLAGEGDGRFLAACANALPEAQFTLIDESPAMLRQAQKRWKKAGGQPERAQFICANLLNWEPVSGAAPGYDLLVTHFFLDCFPPAEMESLLARLASLAAPNARWLLADFHEPSAGFARLRARLTLRCAYALFRTLAGVQARQLTSPDACLARLHYQLIHRSFSDWGRMHSDLWKHHNARPKGKSRSSSG